MKSFRIGADISKKEMAAKLELSVPTYSNYENGYSEPPLESEKIDTDEYNIWIDSLMNSFNIPVENY